MWVLDTLKHLQLIVDHVLIALDDFLEYDLDCDLLAIDFGFTDDSIGTSAQGPSESVLSLLIVAVWLAMEAVEHAGNWRVSALTRAGSIEEAKHVGRR
jgi:hypothetical protein